MNSDPRVGRLLIRWQQLRKQGRTVTVDELCADCPDLIDAVGQQIQKLTALEAHLHDTDDSLGATPAGAAEAEESVPLTMRFAGGASATGDEGDASATLHNSPGPPAPLPSGGSGTVAGSWKPSSSNPAPPPSTPKAGPSDAPTLRGYRLLERLGHGMFGVVYRALSSGGVEVAVKEIRYSVAHDQAQRELGALELIKGLRHPYLLALHDFWVEGDRLYMAMELADGTLAQLAADSGPRGMYQPEVMKLFEEAAEALDFLHQHHVLHRDVKPANILLLRGHTKVADLGLAKFTPAEVAVSQTVAGTPAYMAPETFRNNFRAESDQYALALCYAEVRLGRQLCEGTHLAAAIAWHLYTAPNLEGLRPHEEKAVRRALSKEPADRFPSCQDFIRALQEPQPKPKPGRSWRLLVAALLAVPVLALIVWWFLPRPDKTPPPPPPDTSVIAPVDWTPEHHGFNVPPGALVKTDPIDHKRYYDRIVKRIGDKEVVFLLIPRLKPGDPQTFYMMEDKVTNSLFKAASNDPEFQRLLADAKAKFPTLKWGEWRLGGVRNGNENVGSDDDALPVFRANVMEAYCFAQWIGRQGPGNVSANLPTEPQWDQASGEDSGAKEIYRDPALPLQPGDVAVNRRAEGPMAAGTARRDVSPLGCRDMAGNGKEWTRGLDSGETIPPEKVTPNLMVVVCGSSYFDRGPFRYHAQPDWYEFQLGYPAVGFRVVIEP